MQRSGRSFAPPPTGFLPASQSPAPLSPHHQGSRRLYSKALPPKSDLPFQATGKSIIETRNFYNLAWRLHVGFVLISGLVGSGNAAAAQVPTPPVVAPPASAQPPVTPPTTVPPVAAPSDVSSAPPDPAAVSPPDQPGKLKPEIRVGSIDFSDGRGGIVGSGGVEVAYAGTTVTADKVVGNINRELVLSGNAKIVSHGLTSYADAIHVSPRTRSFRLDNPRGQLDPSLLQNRVLDPVYVTGGAFSGSSTGYSSADHITATTCVEEKHHYEFRIGDAELFPLQKLVMHRVSLYLFGVKVITLPSVTVPLDVRPPGARRPRTDYLPEVGQNNNEGYYVRLPYAFSEGRGAGTFVRLDITQKRGEGYRLEQEYLAGKQISGFSTAGTGPQGGFTGATSGTIANAFGYGSVQGLPGLGTGLGPQNGGLFAVQGYFADGFDRNFNTSFKHQQGIGGSNRFAFSTELQRNSFYIGSNQSSQNTRFNFNHSDAAHGVQGDLTLGVTNTDQSGTFTGQASQITGSLREAFDFDSHGSNRNSLSYSLDANRYLNTSASLLSRTATLDSQFQLQHVSRDYSFSLEANKDATIGLQTGNGNFGSLEKLPELKFSTDTFNYQRGFLRSLPLHFDIGVGRYSEPSHSLTNDRVLLGFTVQQLSLLRGRTEIVTSGGFEQRIYSDSAAQYITRNTTRLRQHIGGRSGIDLNYNYEQPQGGTPFLFDVFGKSHNITAEAGYLDDQHFQFTARVGYDLLGQTPGYAARPFQTLSTRMMVRPNDHLRYDALATYDPNTGAFISFANSVKLRARNDFAIDLIGRYDPTLHKFSQINTQFDIPVGRTWRVQGLWRYNGVTKMFDSRNLQILHEWDCMEASVTYSESPTGFTVGNSRQLYFTLRIKAFPFFRSFARGAAGQALSTGIGDLY
jgi:hypothetical protein